MRIANLFGITVILNRFFLGLMLLFGLLGLLSKALTVFGVVFAHELAHVITARRYGLKVREMELLPFGGVARIEGLADVSPGVELMVAMAGPGCNMVLAGLAWLLGEWGWWSLTGNLFFIRCNIMLAAFNLLPALPLDGGRILRALWARRAGYRLATEQVAELGRITALVLAATSVWLFANGSVNITLLALAFFLFFAATREKGMAIYQCMRHLTRKKEWLVSRGVMVTEQLTALGDTSLKDIIQLFGPQKYHVVLVVDERLAIQGMVTESDIVDALMQKGLYMPVKKLLP